MQFSIRFPYKRRTNFKIIVSSVAMCQILHRLLHIYTSPEHIISIFFPLNFAEEVLSSINIIFAIEHTDSAMLISVLSHRYFAGQRHDGIGLLICASLRKPRQQSTGG